MKDKGIQLTDGNQEQVDLKIDVLRDANGLITQGLVVGNTMKQNQAMILIANPGEFKFNPTLGVAFDELLLDHDYLRMRHRIQEHFSKDGLKIKNIQLAEGKQFLIEASYE